jgi:OmpA-OmpF porin, OOP family
MFLGINNSNNRGEQYVKRLISTMIVAAAVLFLFGCAGKQLSLPQFDAKEFDKNLYLSKVDNFLIIFDASSSMKELCKGNRKMDGAKAIVQRMNQMIPEMGQNAGLRSFGHSSSVSGKPTELLYGIKSYNSKLLANSLKKLNEPGGLTPIASAFTAAVEDLKGLSGKRTAVIIISDGEADAASTIKAAQSLKDEFGKSICFYPIQVGKSANSINIMKQIAEIGGCGFYSGAEKILAGSGMADFVQKVFLKDKPISDSDRDGLTDNYDKCPDTPRDARVNAEGCWVLNDILFDTDNSKFHTSDYLVLDEVAYVLSRNPDLKIKIYGFTDNVGSFKYNVKLSQIRTDAAKAYIVSKGITESRVSTQSFGPKYPVASNASEEGRAKNRRVEIHQN